MFSFSLSLGDSWCEDGLEFVIHNEDNGGTNSSEGVGECSLEEGLSSLSLRDFHETVNGSSVHNISSTRLHHESSTYGI